MSISTPKSLGLGARHGGERGSPGPLAENYVDENTRHGGNAGANQVGVGKCPELGCVGAQM